jgi:hypothetical protein
MESEGSMLPVVQWVAGFLIGILSVMIPVLVVVLL